MVLISMLKVFIRILTLYNLISNLTSQIADPPPIPCKTKNRTYDLRVTTQSVNTPNTKELITYRKNLGSLLEIPINDSLNGLLFI